MLTAHRLSKTYGIDPILKDISFSISRGERAGLIGPNGCGKTTLMRILAGVEAPDSGTVTPTRPGLRIGYLPQGFEPHPGDTIAATLGRAAATEAELAAEVESLASALAARPDDASLQSRYDLALTHLANVHLPAAILAPLGLAHLPPETPTAHLSGGQKTRLMLAKILLRQPHLLLLDEPTNHLDIGMLEWLEGWLAHFDGAALIVSHDRAFLDNTVTRILELDPATHALRPYDGNYTAYLEQKLNEQEQQWQAYHDQQEQIAQLRAAAAHIRGLTKMKKGGKADGGDKFATGFFGNRATKNVARRARHIEARIEKLLNEDRIEKPRPAWQMKLDFAAPEYQSRDVLLTESLSIGYAQNKPLLRGLELQIHAGQRIALMGPNGCGKTTLLRTIAGRLAPLAGSVRLGASARLGYMTQEQEQIDPAQTALAHVQRVSPFNETEARHFLHFFLFSGDDPLRPAAQLSYGERARLELALLVAAGCNFLLLDEPINHLDIPSRTRFEQALSRFEGAVLAVVHDRYFIEHFAEAVWQVEDGHIRPA
ncbi:MAG: ABC-F family ATP-binding cassette domain-containing protein [Anaerolineales bacterium]